MRIEYAVALNELADDVVRYYNALHAIAKLEPGDPTAVAIAPRMVEEDWE